MTETTCVCGGVGTKGVVHRVDGPCFVGDPVNHPTHYTFGSIEVIDALEAWQLPFHLANAVKYIARAGKKDPAKVKEDLQKAVWYLNRYIEKVLK